MIKFQPVLLSVLLAAAPAAAWGPVKAKTSIHQKSAVLGTPHEGLDAFGRAMARIFSSETGTALFKLDPFWHKLRFSPVAQERRGFAGLIPLYWALSTAQRARISATYPQAELLTDKQVAELANTLATAHTNAVRYYAEQTALVGRPKDARDLEAWREYARHLEVLGPYGQQKNYEQARRMVHQLERLKLARTGDGIAAQLKGSADEETVPGQGIVLENARDSAVVYLKKAAADDDGAAQRSVGSMLMAGWQDVIAKDEARGALWYKDAVRRGDARARYELGKIYEDGRGLRPNFVQAYAHYRVAAEAGIAEADEAGRALFKKMTWKQLEAAMAIYDKKRQSLEPKKPASKTRMDELQAIQKTLSDRKDFKNMGTMFFGMNAFFSGIWAIGSLFGTHNPDPSEPWFAWVTLSLTGILFTSTFTAYRRSQRRLREFLLGQ